MAEPHTPNHDDHSAHRQIAVHVVNLSTASDREALKLWAIDLLEIKRRNLSPLERARLAIAITRAHSVLVPVLKVISKEIRRRAWDDRTTASRLGLAGAAIGLALFGGQSAGIAALGTAVGVPLWIVIGSGSAFAGVLIEELENKDKD